MTEYRLSFEHFLATTRQHLFASDQPSALAQGLVEDDAADSCDENGHRAHAAG